jgi:hypothetical protein
VPPVVTLPIPLSPSLLAVSVHGEVDLAVGPRSRPSMRGGVRQ